MVVWAIDISRDRGRTWQQVNEHEAGSPAHQADAMRALESLAKSAKDDGQPVCYRLSAFAKSTGDRSDITTLHTPYLTPSEMDAIAKCVERVAEEVKGIAIQPASQIDRIEFMGRAFASLGFKLPRMSKTKAKASYIALTESVARNIDRKALGTFDVMASAFPLADGEKGIAQGFILFYDGAPAPRG